MVQDQFCGTNYQVVRDIDRTIELNPASFVLLKFDGQAVFETDGLKDRSQLVVTVRAFVENPEVEIDFGKGRYNDTHSSVLNEREQVVAGEFFTALKKFEFNHEAEANDGST